MIYTFWEGRMPEYIRLCLATWPFDFTILDFTNLHNYMDTSMMDKVKRFSVAQVADFVRVHVLRNHGGYWLDADTIMLSDVLPDVPILGDPAKRTNTIGYLHADPGDDMFTAWAEYQDTIATDPNASHHWSIMGNAFTDPYLDTHRSVPIGDIRPFSPEAYVLSGDTPRMVKYQRFYFENEYHMRDIEDTTMLMLHNSWTPRWYKEFDMHSIIRSRCTLSNIFNSLSEVRDR